MTPTQMLAVFALGLVFACAERRAPMLAAGASDLEITRRVRQTLLERHALSPDAMNVSVVTEAGYVTLRGNVESDAERREIYAIARTIAGHGRVGERIGLWPY